MTLTYALKTWFFEAKDTSTLEEFIDIQTQSLK